MYESNTKSFFYCENNCEHLNFTEKEQDLQKHKQPHKCLKYNKRIFHHKNHPNLHRLDECKQLEFNFTYEGE
jgi:hypothetical protein